jgi:hypothetical protein
MKLRRRPPPKLDSNTGLRRFGKELVPHIFIGKSRARKFLCDRRCGDRDQERFASLRGLGNPPSRLSHNKPSDIDGKANAHRLPSAPIFCDVGARRG